MRIAGQKFDFTWMPEKELERFVKSLDVWLERGAKAIRNEAKESSAFTDRTGNLRSAIQVVRSKYKNENRRVGAGLCYWLVKVDYSVAPHAHLVEFGHENARSKKSGKMERLGRTPPHPFMRPAVRKSRAEIREMMEAFVARWS